MEASEILVVLAGWVLVISGVFLILRRYVYLKSCCTVRVVGNILDMERNVREHYDQPDSVSFSMKYRYFVDDVEYVKRRSIGKRQLKATRNSYEVTVFYDPTRPKRHYVLELKFRMLLTLTLIAIGAILLYYSYSDVSLI